MSGPSIANPPGERGLTAQASTARPPTPLLRKESGNLAKNAVADVVDRMAAPFQSLGQPNVSAFDKAAGVVSAAGGLTNAPVDFLNDAFARATSSVAKVLPSFRAATMGALVIGMPHTHTHPPSLVPPAPPIPLPAIGAVMTGCPTVLLGGMPAARAGDFGMAPTCGSISPVFEIVTGSSNVFIGGARAARVLDITKQCTPKAPSAGAAGKAAGAVSKLGKAVAIAGKVMEGTAKLSMAMGIVGAGVHIIEKRSAAAAADAAATQAQAAADAADAAADAAAAAAAEAKSAAAAAAADASAAILAAAMLGADLALNAVKTAMGNMMGKDPGAPMCIGAVTIGMPTILIGGFPMPSWTDVAKGLKKLAAALGRARRGGVARGRALCLKCI